MDWGNAAYTRKQWIWAVNLCALLAASGFVVPNLFFNPPVALEILPLTLVVTFLISWGFIAWPLRLAMKNTASYWRVLKCASILAAGIALVGFGIKHAFLRNGQIGSGEFLQMKDGVLTPYGWTRVAHRNLLFIAYGVGIASIIRAIIGPGRTPK